MDGLTPEDHDMIVEPEYDEKNGSDVAIIRPPSGTETSESEDKDSVLTADNYEGILRKFMPDPGDLEVVKDGWYTWEVEGWSTLGKRLSSPAFEVDGTPWKILFFPHGNNAEFTSLYLEHGYDPKPPEDWYKCVQFILVLWNPQDPRVFTTHQAQHRFNADEGDWGFTRYYELRKLHIKDDRERPLVENDKANITAYVRVVKDPTGVLWHNFVNYDSKKETGYVGLKNQGATCYLNSLLQSLYFTKCFKKAVYQIPTENEKTDNSALTLQRLFYNLTHSADALSTNELTKSFGWETKHIFEQQDVQELSRVLMEKLEEKMKGTEAENALTKMFVGKTKTYISCINVQYESSRIEDFWDIQLNVRGFKNLDESFKDYVAVETLDGENKYFAEGYGLQDAKKGVIFESFPPVFHMQLKRFEYDIQRDAMMKVNDHYEFPEEFDASPYLSEDADKSEPYVYRLHGVLVHSGDLNAGHYYAFLKPEQDSYWYKFDDDRVTRATMKEVLNENYGGDMPGAGMGPMRNPYSRTLSLKRSMSAYMLVYLRKSRLDEILPKEDYPPPDHLQIRLEEERIARELKKKEKDEQHLYIIPRVISNEHFCEHQGFDLISWDLKDAGASIVPKSYKVLKQSMVREFVKTVADDLNEPPEKVRLWVMVNRQNKTVRPDTPLTNLDMPIEEAAIKYGVKGQDFRLWAEVASGPDAAKTNWSESYVWQPNGQIVVFLKHFDPENQTLKGVNHIYMKKNDKVSDITPIIMSEMKWPASTAIKLFEEIKPSMIEAIKPKQTFQAAEIQDGDIICFQKVLNEKEASSLASNGFCVDAKEFYDQLVNKLVMKFYPKFGSSNEKDVFELVLNKKMHYEQLANKVGEYLNVPGTHLRFTLISVQQGSSRNVLKRNNNQTLQQMLQSTYMQHVRNDAIYYEVLDLSLSELETKKVIRLNWIGEDLSKEEAHDILAPKNGTLMDVVDELRKKVNMTDEEADLIRFWEVHSSKIHKELPLDFNLAGIQEFVHLYAEKETEENVPSEEEEEERYIRCFHFQREPSKSHGTPFKFVIKRGEPFKDTKLRLSKRIGIKGKNFEKIKFAVVSKGSYSKPQYIEDDDIIWDVMTNPDDLLGLDHVDKTPRGLFGRTEQSIFIR